MNKTEFVNAIAEKRGITKKEAAELANDIIGIMEDAVASGDGFSIIGSFSIKTVYKPAKTRWNEMLQKDIDIPAKMAVKISVGKGLKERVNLLTDKHKEGEDVLPF